MQSSEIRQLLLFLYKITLLSLLTVNKEQSPGDQGNRNTSFYSNGQNELKGGANMAESELFGSSEHCVC